MPEPKFEIFEPEPLDVVTFQLTRLFILKGIRMGRERWKFLAPLNLQKHGRVLFDIWESSGQGHHRVHGPTSPLVDRFEGVDEGLSLIHI